MVFISVLIECSSPNIESPSNQPDVVYRNGTYDRPWQTDNSVYDHYDTIDEPNYDYIKLQSQQPQQPATSKEAAVTPALPPRHNDNNDYIVIVG